MLGICIRDDTFGFRTRVVDVESYIWAEVGVVGGEKSCLIVCRVYWDLCFAVR